MHGSYVEPTLGSQFPHARSFFSAGCHRLLDQKMATSSQARYSQSIVCGLRRTEMDDIRPQVGHHIFHIREDARTVPRRKPASLAPVRINYSGDSRTGPLSSV